MCGINNTAGLKAKLYECEIDGEIVLLTIATPGEQHQSYPDRMHGGIIATLLDESIGRSIQAVDDNIWGVTIELNIKYRKPVPLNQTLYVESRASGQTSRTFDASGKLFLADGTVCATATGRFFKCPAETITEGLNEENHFYVKEKLPKFIIIKPKTSKSKL